MHSKYSFLDWHKVAVLHCATHTMKATSFKWDNRIELACDVHVFQQYTLLGTSIEVQVTHFCPLTL